jgi:hypothetical protein
MLAIRPSADLATHNLIKMGDMVFYLVRGNWGVQHFAGLLSECPGAPSFTFHRHTLLILRHRMDLAVVVPRLDSVLEVVE